MKVVITYTIVTEESAVNGDYSECGYENEESIEYDDIDDLISYLKSQGATNPSSTQFHEGIWYSTESNQDMYTGEYREESYHLKDISPLEEHKVYVAITKGRGY
jgi:hypothetical protein